MSKIRSWSFSRLLDFESCPLKAKLKIIDKIPEPERPLPPGKTEHANDRGTRVHEEVEAYIRGTGPFPKEAEYFRDEIESLKKRFKKGEASLEGEWGYDKDWQVTDWKYAWLRVKLDASVFIEGNHAAVIDYKTGKKFGNEMKHGQQLELYALATFLRYPQVEVVTAELWYLDMNDLTRLDIVRPVGMRALKPFDKRGRKMTECEEFKATPNIESCKYCPYHPARGSGDCPHGV